MKKLFVLSTLLLSVSTMASGLDTLVAKKIADAKNAVSVEKVV